VQEEQSKERLKRQNGTGQNGIGQNGTDNMVTTFLEILIQFILVTKSHNTQRTPKGVKAEARLMTKSYCQWGHDRLFADFIHIPFYTYHFVQCHFIHIPFCPRTKESDMI